MLSVKEQVAIVADPEGVHLKPPSRPRFKYPYENERIWSQ